jgi:protein-disulfide isomerase
MKKWLKRLAIAVILIALSLAVGRILLLRAAVAHMSEAPLGQFIGPEDAKDVVVEFLDYRCPACRATHPEVMAFHRAHPDVKIVFRHLPIFGDPSIYEAHLVLAAGMNGKFMEMQEIMFSREEAVTDADLPEVAQELGLDPEGLRADMRSIPVMKEVLWSVLAAYGLKVSGTPSFAFNGQLLQEDRDLEHALREIGGQGGMSLPPEDAPPAAAE